MSVKEYRSTINDLQPRVPPCRSTREGEMPPDFNYRCQRESKWACECPNQHKAVNQQIPISMSVFVPISMRVQRSSIMVFSCATRKLDLVQVCSRFEFQSSHHQCEVRDYTNRKMFLFVFLVLLLISLVSMRVSALRRNYKSYMMRRWSSIDLPPDWRS